MPGSAMSTAAQDKLFVKGVIMQSVKIWESLEVLHGILDIPTF